MVRASLKSVLSLATIAATAATLVTSAAIADDEIIIKRQNVMKNVGAATKMMAAMVKGEMPYDAGKAELAFRTLHSTAAGYAFMFPEGSEIGAETEAKIEIWDNRDDFNAKAAEFEADALAAIEAVKSGEDAAKAAFGEVAANCKACHSLYKM